jgi:hypothetical protein
MARRTAAALDAEYVKSRLDLARRMLCYAAGFWLDPEEVRARIRTCTTGAELRALIAAEPELHPAGVAMAVEFLDTAGQ